MSQSKSQYQAERWWLTAQEDLEVAETLHAVGKYAPACFLSQQSAEKAAFFLEEIRKFIRS